uniref:Si:dkey-78k11.9 n=1 Tax=Fundulus heteroclitus TaxID=8078 RepID=A0A3Q2QMF1_FUNHE
FWNSILWTDETKLHLCQNDGKKKIWRIIGTAHDPKHSTSSVKQGGGSVRAWACMGIDILVINLGLADMLYLLTLPFLITYHFKGSDWIFGEAFCKITRFCFKVNLYCSIGFLTCISVYRYLAIVYPLKTMGKLTVTNCAVISAMVWILVSAQSVPDMFFPKHPENKTNKCYDTTDWDKVEDYFSYSLSVTFIGFCIPSGIILGCYGHVTLVVCRSNTMKKDVKQRIINQDVTNQTQQNHLQKCSAQAQNISPYGYLAIVYPFEALRKLTVTNSAVISAMVWILVSAQRNMTNKCYDTTDWDKVEDYFPYSLSVTFLGFCIPSGIIVGCYGHVTLVVCSSNTVKTDVKQRSSKLLVLLILYFSLCFAPYHVFKNLNLYSRVLMKEGTCPPWNAGVFIAHQASRGLVSLNSALNPLVYLNVNEDMGTQFRQLLQGSRQISRRLFQSKSSSETQTEQEVDSPRKESALLNELHHV